MENFWNEISDIWKVLGAGVIALGGKEFIANIQKRHFKNQDSETNEIKKIKAREEARFLKLEKENELLKQQISELQSSLVKLKTIMKTLSEVMDDDIWSKVKIMLDDS